MNKVLLALVLGVMIPGGYAISVISVYDGDTFKAEVEVWPGMHVVRSIRVRGVDTPELRGECPEEKAMASEAKSATTRWLLSAPSRVTNIDEGKYAGRVIADVVRDDGSSLAEYLIEAGYGRAYEGGRRVGWCDKKTEPKEE